MTGIGASLWQSAQNILQSQANLNRLCEAMDHIECEDADLFVAYEDSDPPAKDFLQPVWNRFYEVSMPTMTRKKRKRMAVVGYLTVAIQLTSDEGEEGPWAHGKRAKALIGYAESDDYDQRWVFDTEDPNASGYCDNCEALARHWRFNDPDVPSWFFALPLDLLTSPEAVRNLIVTPVHEILRSRKVDEALLKIEHAICFPPQARDC